MLRSYKLIQESSIHYLFEVHATSLRCLTLLTCPETVSPDPAAMCWCADRLSSTSIPSHFYKVNSCLLPIRWIAKVNASWIWKHTDTLMIEWSWMLWKDNETNKLDQMKKEKKKDAHSLDRRPTDTAWPFPRYSVKPSVHGHRIQPAHWEQSPACAELCQTLYRRTQAKGLPRPLLTILLGQVHANNDNKCVHWTA